MFPGFLGQNTISCLLVSFVFSFLAISPKYAFSDPGEEYFPPVEIVVSATRSEMPIDQVASSISVVDSKEIERQQDSSLLEVLKSQPTLDVVSTGGKGASTSVSMRGANSEHTLVILDGIELNNPILPSRSFNFADLMLNDVERIEILRGPQSTLYGSDALGGVVNVVSKKGEGPVTVGASAEAGSNSSYIEQAAVSAGEEQYNYAFSFLREDVGGISAADSRLGNEEKDSYENSSYFSRFGISPTEDTDINTIFRAIDSNSELDNAGGVLGEDLNREQSNTQFFWGTSLTSSFLDDDLKSTISYTLADQSFKDDNDPDVVSMEFLRSKYEGRLSTVQGQLDYKVNENLSLIAGTETEEETGQSRFASDGAFGTFESNFTERSSTNNAYYLQNTISFSEMLFVNSGLRVDDNSKFGTETTWRIAPALVFEGSGTRLFSTVGTAYKAPSLSQLYSSYGSQDLDPESSFAVDAGVKQEIISEVLALQLTYFHQNFDNLINFEPNTFIFSNINSATTSGLESELTAGVCDWIEVAMGYTYLDATNDETGAALLRRSRNKFSAEINVIPADSWEFGIQSNYRSSRIDNDFSAYPAKTEVLAGYATVDLLGRYHINKDVQLFARVENLFDNNYSEVFGYGTTGLTAYGGAKVTF
jgi:vitamin B12 transporter